MAWTNLGANAPDLPDWARVHNLRIAFDYAGPLEVAKSLMGYRWGLHDYSIDWLYRRVRDYDANKAEQMARAGANAGCLVWSTGFSIENESAHWDIVRRRIAEFHQRGMGILVYCSLTNCFWQEMFQTVPEAAGWRQVGPDGEPCPYEGIHYGDREVTRYLMCCNHPDWRAYQKRRIEAALAAGVDGIFWDNNFSKCHCPYCQEGFRQFTTERLGTPHDLPRPIGGDAPTERDLRSAREVIFDWIALSHPDARVHLAKNLFRYRSVLGILEDLKAHAVAIKPDVIWCNNGHLCQDIYDSANLMLSEDLDPPGYDAATGVLRTNAGVLRYLYEECGRGTPAIVNSKHPETFAYGATGFGMRDPEVNAFVAANAALYENAQSVARVGLAAAEMNYINKRSHWFDNLVRHHLLFDAMPVHRLEAFDLSLYDVIGLRSILFLSDAACERLRAFVAAGGTLIATNDSSLYDETWRRRADYGLTDVFGVSAGDADQPDRHENRFGAGTSIFYPGAAERAIEAEPNGPVAERIAADIRAHLADAIVEVAAPAGVAVNVMRAAVGLVVHVLNYAEAPAEGVRIRLTALAANGADVREVLPLGNGSAEADDVDRSDGLALTLPRVGRYTAVVVA